jgi:tRNA(Ile)-lysidine synthetase-like protein
LALRRWKEGDSFQPFGMEGKSKKVSKLLKTQIIIIRKENGYCGQEIQLFGLLVLDKGAI